jgi:hypothetical protein
MLGADGVGHELFGSGQHAVRRGPVVQAGGREHVGAK